MSKHLKTPTNRAKRFPRLTLTTLLAATAILAIAAVAAISRQNAGATGPDNAERSLQMAKKSNESFVTVNAAGQDVTRRTQAGQIQPLTQAEAQKLAAGFKQMVNQSTDGLVQVRHADGSVSMDLQGRFQNVTVARVNKDGSVTQSCVDNPQAAGAFFGIDPGLIVNQSNSKAEGKRRRPKVVETHR